MFFFLFMLVAMPAAVCGSDCAYIIAPSTSDAELAIDRYACPDGRTLSEGDVAALLTNSPRLVVFLNSPWSAYGAKAFDAIKVVAGEWGDDRPPLLVMTHEGWWSQSPALEAALDRAVAASHFERIGKYRAILLYVEREVVVGWHRNIVSDGMTPEALLGEALCVWGLERPNSSRFLGSNDKFC